MFLLLMIVLNSSGLDSIGMLPADYYQVATAVLINYNIVFCSLSVALRAWLT